MKLKKALTQTLLLAVALVLLSVSTGEGFFHRHHHHEKEDNCAYCHWSHTGSQAVAAQAPPVPYAMFFVFSIPISHYELILPRRFQPRGRAPPVGAAPLRLPGDAPKA